MTLSTVSYNVGNAMNGKSSDRICSDSDDLKAGFTVDSVVYAEAEIEILDGVAL